MKIFINCAIITIVVLAVGSSSANAESKGWRATKKNAPSAPSAPNDRDDRVVRRGFGLYLGVTPFYDISRRSRRAFPHIIPHAHIGSHHPHYHHRGNVLLPRHGVGFGVGLRYGIFRSRSIGLGIHIR